MAARARQGDELVPGRRKDFSAEPGIAGFEQYTYDPHHPTPTLGGAVCCNPKVFPWGPMDQREVESRTDVLVFSTHRR